ncbi:MULTISPECIES: glycosyltransferase [Sorangium]|uniref:Glycosyltransferase 2-like domain-containing protein n=1 Tax=Sorangium cellulosum TaxID=56 RepID=A0A4P2QUV1_SORCE|nr:MULTISPECIES: glycosyltransferase [Sorangium]AUX34179.1 hypothetical protein SOCE836_063480 [Sorangium cellulosum]WCQ93492.1 hypothetical protein NQZ70_06241 [Sorangium sp. Soce836]
MAPACVALLTFSVDRPRLLAEAIRSVLAQRDAPPIRQIVFSERTAELRADAALDGLKDRVQWVPLETRAYEGHSSPRMAALRQLALGYVQETYVGFLDDDNTLAPEHIANLVRMIENQNLSAAHSWRELSHPDGTPFDGSFYPWHADPAVARDLHAWCVENGVMIPGSAVVRDGVREGDDPRNVATVDMNEWLFETEALRAIGFETAFTDLEVANQVGEDDKLLRRVRRAGLRFACSEMPTVRYRLGGVSNKRRTDAPEGAR